MNRKSYHVIVQNEYNRNTFLWGPDIGDPILAKDLTASHLCNIINWIQDRPEQYGDGEVLAFMMGEAKYRQLASWTNDEQYVIINDAGRAELVFCTQDRENVQNMLKGAKK